MLTRCLIVSAIMAILSTGYGLAQSSLSPAPAPRASAPGASLAPGTAGAGFLSRQTSDQWLATKFINRIVFGTDGNPVGRIRDLVLDRDGTIAGVVIAANPNGDGEKAVGVPFKSLQATRASNNEERFILQVTRSDLRSAPEFAAGDSPPTTGAGSGSGLSPDATGGPPR